MAETLSVNAIRDAGAGLVACAGRIRDRGWCEGTSGNFSVVAGREPLRLLITPSGADKGRLDPSSLLLLGDDGRSVDATAAAPSAECALHLLLTQELGANAVLHTHSVWGTLLGERFADRGGFRLTGYEMLKGLDGPRSHEDEVWVPVVPNSQEMAILVDALRVLARDRPALCGFLIAGHGLYAWGRDLAEAMRHVEIFEFLFELAGRRVRLDPFTGQ